MDALKIDAAIVVGFDWGARSADIMAILWPERTRGIVSVSGYIIVNREANQKPLPPPAELGWWYHYRWRLSLADGEAGYDRHEESLLELPAITVPAITIGSDFDGAAADGKPYRAKFAGRYAHKVLPGFGHNVPQEPPQAFADAVIEVHGN
jgi:pimeloyl-ACP methyl ester carboxylesterase